METHLQHAVGRVQLWRDLVHIEPLPAHLAPNDERWQALLHELEPLHERYVTEVSDRNWAASLELSAFLWQLCRAVDARRVLELGSGFTSYVFRRYAAEADHDVQVLSIDDDDAWLEKTSAFLRSLGVPDRDLTPLRERDGALVGQFDLVFNDIVGAIRPAMTAVAADHTKPGGVLVLDDANRVADRRSLLTAAREHRLRTYDLRPWTQDAIGRWALLATDSAPLS